jgi:hypothetical protein
VKVSEAKALIATAIPERGGIVEYDRRGSSRWVPYPIAAARLSTLTSAAGLWPPAITARRASLYGGDLYVATMRRAEESTVSRKLKTVRVVIAKGQGGE